MSETLRMSLVFLLKEDEVLLAMKKRGFGSGLYNGAGGKLEAGEDVEQAARRECAEEIGVEVGELEAVARFNFTNSGQPPNLVSVFFCRNWKGEPSESEEMRPKWFKRSELPYERMWEDDRYWLPRVLAGEKLVGNFYFDADQKLIGQHVLPVESF